MKANKIFLVIILIVCAFGAQLFLKSEGQTSDFVVELLPIGPDGEDVVLTKEIQDRTIEVFRKRIDPDGTKGVPIQTDGLNRLFVGVPEEKDPVDAAALIERVGQFEFRVQTTDASNHEMKWITRMNGSTFDRADAEPNPYAPNESWQVNFELTSQGKTEFAELTQELVGKPLGIFIDGEEISAPIVQGPITDGQGVIAGNFTKEEALEMARYLNAGTLPVKVKIVSSTAR